MHKEVAGYNPARGDFDHEFENLAELKIKDVDFDTMQKAVRDLDSGVRIQLTAVQVYKNKLKSRMKRKRVVQEMGLLNKGRAASLPSVYHKITKAGSSYERLFKLGRIMCSYDFDYLLESFQHEMGLRQRILQLQECRFQGLSWLHSTDFYFNMKAQREQYYRDIKQEERIRDWLPRMFRGLAPCPVAGSCSTVLLPVPMSTRRSAAPLEIIGLPGFEKLDESERDLCSEIRVYPETFLEIRDTLIAECEKLDGLRLANARPVIKIDVNKTRKIYDFLLKKKLIRKPKS
jgi:transcriptional adapter 2-alpha